MKQELKQALKPLIKTCIKEMLLEDQLLSNIVREVVAGLSSNMNIPALQNNKTKPEILQQLEAQKQQIMQSMQDSAYSSTNGVNVFDGTKSLPENERFDKQKYIQSVTSQSTNGVNVFANNALSEAKQRMKKLQETAYAGLGVNPFEGTEPLQHGGHTANSGVDEYNVPSPLSALDPRDPGIDLNIFSNMNNWKKMAVKGE